MSSGSTSKARDLLTPTGEIAVVGCAANRTVRDWVWSARCYPMRRCDERCITDTYCADADGSSNAFVI